MFGWRNKIFWLIKLGWLYTSYFVWSHEIFYYIQAKIWLVQSNALVNLKKRFGLTTDFGWLNQNNYISYKNSFGSLNQLFLLI